MNIQDISDFLDLVKNPDKYAAALQTLKEEQERLNEVIATVGKASELDKLRKAVDKQKQSLEADFQNRVVTFEQQCVVTQKSLEKQKQDVAEQKDAAIKAEQEAIAIKTRAEALASSFAGREKILRKAEEDVAQRAKEVSAMQVEYNEKLAKLRSVMG